jgi:hypothetical protein
LVFREIFGMRWRGLTGPHLARLPSNRKGRLPEPVENPTLATMRFALFVQCRRIERPPRAI